MLAFRQTICICILFMGTQLATGSEGDQNPRFVQCVAHCSRTGCTDVAGRRNTCGTICNTQPIPATLVVTRWDCQADCQYHCMWEVEAARQQQPGYVVYKYHGKWPFIRVLGMQELASVLFSLLNLAAHAHNIRRLMQQHRALRKTTKATYPFRHLWLAYGVFSVNAWLCSTVFHTRDTWLTERLDYFSADALVACSTATALLRICGITAPLKVAVLGLAALLALLRHVYYMLFVKFDYGYNMQVCIVLGISQALLWLAWSIRVAHPSRGKLYKFLAGIHVAMLLEVLDFPPLLRLLDAHSLWHLATAGIIYLWYDFLIGDMQWQMALSKVKM